MELSWINKLRIAVVLAVGIVVIGILAWPLAAPDDPLLPVRASIVSPLATGSLLVLAFAVGFACYFIAWPHGREIGILAVPMGLAVWAGRSGPMQELTQVSRDTPERAALFHSLRFEPIYWMAVVAAGFAGVLAAQYLHHRVVGSAVADQPEKRLHTNASINGLIAVVLSIVVTQFFIGVLVQNLGIPRVVTQPEMGQIIFGIITAFAIAAFVVKRFLDLSYVWPALASLFVTSSAQVLYDRGDTLQQFAETRAATCFPHVLFALLPLQLVALGALGSILGYWMAVRYDYWRKHESAG